MMNINKTQHSVNIMQILLRVSRWRMQVNKFVCNLLLQLLNATNKMLACFIMSEVLKCRKDIIQTIAALFRYEILDFSAFFHDFFYVNAQLISQLWTKFQDRFLFDIIHRLMV